MAETDTEQCHPSYNSQDGDLLLSSSDGVLFNVHSEVLRRASGFFKDMYNMPRSADETPGPLTAKADIVAAALDIVYPDSGYPTLTSVADFQDLQSFGDYYSMPKVGSHLRTLIQTSIRASSASGILGGDPLKIYVLCCQFGLEEDAKLASAETLRIDLNSGSYDATLGELSGKNLLRLMRLHQRRRHGVLDAIRLRPREFLQSPECERAVMIKGRYVTRPHDIQSSWPTLVQLIYEAVEREPLDCVLGDRKFLDRPELETLWDREFCAKCGNIVCSKEKFWKSVQVVLDRSPKTV
ncbi:hypothetical protein BD410DRAFT_783577 [Rickenella mellea]|uniref:BTB domain-containing protein n=1 Tax=Rickenella mellea TaxID=50990 RepID=A0A4Y7QFW3_9AGAM|nr:hypothetical protein BD410DRAFT_783577 [Rickenella mellea]